MPITKHSTVSEIIKDKHFKSTIQRLIAEIKEKRNQRWTNLQYKRDWYDRMDEAGLLKTQEFLEHLPDVWTKTSPLCKQFRDVIEYIGGQALLRTLAHYDGLKQPLKQD